MESSDNSVEAYVALAANARGAAAVELINKATSDPKVYNFGELLGCKTIDAVRTNVDLKHICKACEKPLSGDG